MLTHTGELLWFRAIGEFPMVLEIDRNYNTYLAGKSRELFSFDGNGRLRWRRRVTSNAIASGFNQLSAGGDLLVLGTVGGWLEAYHSTGQVLWQRRLPGTSLGHNALDMTPDGRYILAGCSGEQGQDGYLVLYDRDGSVLWQTRFPDKRDAGEITTPYSYAHPHRGVITVAISDDGAYLAAGYGDGTLRVFEWEPDSTQTATETSLPAVFSLTHYPNPSHTTITIRFSLPRSVHVTLKVFDILGREVAVLRNRTLPAGFHTVTFNARTLGAGVYVYRLQAGTLVVSRQMIVLP